MNGSMNISAQTGGQDSLKLPWDLSQWFDKNLLLDWVEKEVGTLDWSNPKLVEFLKQNPRFRPRMMLCLLTRCYATGIFESEEIYEACHGDIGLRDLCEDQPPSASAIGRFRRENRGLLKWCLAQVFKRAFRARFDLKDTLLPAGVKRYLDETAIMRLDVARQIDRGSSGL